MPVKALPSNPNLNHLKYQAKDLLKAHSAQELEAAQRIREFHPHFSKAKDLEIFKNKLSLADAQLTIARECGFSSWAKLKRRVEKPSTADNLNLPHHKRIEDVRFRRAVELLDAGDVNGLQVHLKKHPALVQQHVLFEGGNYFRNPTLLEFVAENPIRNGSLPPNIVEVAKVILEAGAKQNASALNEALELVSSGRVAREHHVQIPLIDLLCDYGADPNQAVNSAIAHAEFEAVNALRQRGTEINLLIAAAFGHMEDFNHLLPSASPEQRHQALALASQFGRTEIVKILLDAGENPCRYNPVGFQSHSTPLHQAAFAGHQEIVRLLVECGAYLAIKDTLWKGTPVDWAKYADNKQIAAYLEEREKPRKTQN